MAEIWMYANTFNLIAIRPTSVFLLLNLNNALDGNNRGSANQPASRRYTMRWGWADEEVGRHNWTDGGGGRSLDKEKRHWISLFPLSDRLWPLCRPFESCWLNIRGSANIITLTWRRGGGNRRSRINGPKIRHSTHPSRLLSRATVEPSSSCRYFFLFTES